MDSGDCTQATGQEIVLNKFMDYSDQLPGRQFIGKRAYKLTSGTSIPAHFRTFDLIAEMLEISELLRCIIW